MKTSKLLGILTALMLTITLGSCTSTYYSRPNYGRHYGARRPYGPPPRPYGGNGGYGNNRYGRPGW